MVLRTDRVGEPNALVRLVPSSNPKVERALHTMMRIFDSGHESAVGLVGFAPGGTRRSDLPARENHIIVQRLKIGTVARREPSRGKGARIVTQVAPGLGVDIGTGHQRIQHVFWAGVAERFGPTGCVAGRLGMGWINANR